MNAATLIESIQAAYPGLSQGGRRVAELIVSRPEDVALSSAAKIAQELNVSESTVVRFATAIGFDGYPALRRTLQEDLRRHAAPAVRLSQHAPGHDRADSPAARSFQADVTDLLATQRGLDLARLTEAAELISSAREVHILGQRSSFGLAFTLFHHLSRMFRGIRLLDCGRGDVADQLVHLEDQDLLIGISFPRYARSTIETCSIVAARGIRLISITDGPLSPLASISTVMLSAYCSAEPFANSNVGALATINALISQTAIGNQPHSVRSLNLLEELLGQTGGIFPREPSTRKLDKKKRKKKRV
jgi:DNA-binding MurR/RpiR family transcriptional regulator